MYEENRSVGIRAKLLLRGNVMSWYVNGRCVCVFLFLRHMKGLEMIFVGVSKTKTGVCNEFCRPAEGRALF